MQGAAGQLIAEIRRESGLNQAELARRAGLPASVLSAYARGRRQPGVDALARIAAAADLAIRIDRRADQAERLERTRKAWERGGDEGKQLDRLRARRMSHEQRIDEGLALARIAEQLQAGRQAR
jgi:transcriptional regulator with XRE-family HTH domain